MYNLMWSILQHTSSMHENFLEINWELEYAAVTDKATVMLPGMKAYSLQHKGM